MTHQIYKTNNNISGPINSIKNFQHKINREKRRQDAEKQAELSDLWLEAEGRDPNVHVS